MNHEEDNKNSKHPRGPVSEYGEFVSWFDRWIRPIEENKKARKKDDHDF